MKVEQFCESLYNHVFSVLDAEDVHSSPCGVGGPRAGLIATMVARMAKVLLEADTGSSVEGESGFIDCGEGFALAIADEDGMGDVFLEILRGDETWQQVQSLLDDRPERELSIVLPVCDAFLPLRKLPPGDSIEFE